MSIRISRRLIALAPSATLATVEKARALRERGVDVIDFSAGQPDFDTPEHIKDAAIEALRQGDTKYPSPTAGKAPLRRAICEFLWRWCELKYDPGQICVTVGAKDALHLAFAALLDPGDEVLIPAPYWVSYPEQVRLADGVPVVMNDAIERGGKITAAELERALTPRTRLLVLNSPSNPTGAVFRRRDLEALADVLRGTDVLVISDEIYHRLVFDGEPYTSFATLPGMYDRTITINGFSKTYAMTGWRLGYAAGPSEVIAAMTRYLGQTTSGPPSFVQTAGAVALLQEHGDVERMKAAYQQRAELMHGALNAIRGVKCSKPEGAFYCFPDVASVYGKLGVKNADEFAEQVLERAHVALVSGTQFGCPTHVRLSYATSTEAVREGMSRLAKLLG